MIKTTYTCDACKKGIVREGAKRDQLWYVTVYYREGASPQIAYSTGTREVHWCRACMERAGLTPVVELKENPPEVVKTLEDVVREIVREEISECEI
jgi:hypothetical protein